MYPDCAVRVTLYEGLRRIDDDLAARAQEAGCPRCGGPLDKATWTRKPRGCKGLPDDLCLRQGMCCRACRRRVLPDSTVFLGRKVYLGAVVLISIVVRQRSLASHSANRLRAMFGMSKRTLGRWLRFFLVEFPASTRWKVLRGLVSARVRDDALPDALLAEFDRRHDGPGPGALSACLAFVARGELQAS